MSAGYLLDTNICVHFLRGEHQLDKKLAAIGLAKCFLSEITIAELLFGAANSAPVWQVRQHQQITEFRELFAEQVLPIGPTLEIFAAQKAHLRRAGRPIDDFDILIGCTALTHSLTLVTRNTRHFTNLSGLQLENWIDTPPRSDLILAPALQ
ncbi:type II toxin-antitoxin system VapC family toxin [Hymenobacter chitinivorans]|uniref:Ribonuclease VapC n=1 Tax=Hymenobacter chitinivorans DSM 11115 TaxID=1121954 RepID=A0A2M9BKX2_9BACT|nr:type II toxin-antitoxin system VapC family toxin [Hymenobacter chitinivorans]PJJ58598.1 tRNA(fMet)-specific endonuclease VapC [Hymenobacter chitinivorans DSM 11115]